MRDYLKDKRNQLKWSRVTTAFTLIELIVVFAIIGILVTVTVVSYNSWRQSTIVAQIKSDLNNVASAMENARTFSNGYPATVPSTFSPSSGVTLTGGSTDGGKTYCVSAVNSSYPTTYYHIDSVNSSSGAQAGDCATWIAGSGVLAGKSVRSADLDFKYQYKTKQTNVASPQGATNLDPSYTSNYSLVSPQAYPTVDFGEYPAQNACKAMGGRLPTMQELAAIYAGAASYGNNFQATTPYISATENSAANVYAIWFNNGSVGVPAKDGPFSIRCVKGDGGSISAPSAPTVSTSTTGGNTTWSWGAASCGANSARYQYRYTISPSGFDSGLVPISTTSVVFSTSAEGQTYTVAVQAECYNDSAASGMGTAGSANYVRSVTTYTLTTAAGTGGTVSAGGTYNSGTAQTITATPNASYIFKNWTGSEGCVGQSSHTIVMDGNKTCTANFVRDPNSFVDPPESAPVVSVAVRDASSHTWSWGAVSCGANSVRYQYRYTISPSGYDSGWVQTTATSVWFTTSTQGQTYVVATQAECYNGSGASGYIGTGSASYYRPNVYTLTLTNGGGSAGETGAGSYTEGTVVTIGANPALYYVFSSWIGSTGCAGTQSHNITMDANKTCSAQYNGGAGWIAGVNSMSGKWVRNADLGSLYAYKTAATANASPQGLVGADPGTPADNALVNPQVNTGVDFSAYTAQNQCKAQVGGRLPTFSESLYMYNDRVTYGNNFNTSAGLRTANQNPLDNTQARNRNMSTGGAAVSSKTNANPVRCVKGPQ